MKFSKRIVVAVFALPLMIGSMSAMAYGGKHHGGAGMYGGNDMMGQYLLRGVDLTDEQQEQMNTFREQHRATMQASMGRFQTQMMAERQQIHTLMLADNFDEAAVRALVEKMVDQQVERRVAMMQQKHQMLSILTPEQKAQVKENMANMSDRMQKRMQKNM